MGRARNGPCRKKKSVEKKFSVTVAGEWCIHFSDARAAFSNEQNGTCVFGYINLEVVKRELWKAARSLSSGFELGAQIKIGFLTNPERNKQLYLNLRLLVC